MSFVLTNSLCGCSGTGSTGDHYHHCDGCIIATVSVRNCYSTYIIYVCPKRKRLSEA